MLCLQWWWTVVLQCTKQSISQLSSDTLPVTPVSALSTVSFRPRRDRYYLWRTVHQLLNKIIRVHVSQVHTVTVLIWSSSHGSVKVTLRLAENHNWTVMVNENLGVEWLTALCNQIATKGRIHDDWNYIVSLPVFEGTGCLQWWRTVVLQCTKQSISQLSSDTLPVTPVSALSTVSFRPKRDRYYLWRTVHQLLNKIIRVHVSQVNTVTVLIWSSSRGSVAKVTPVKSSPLTSQHPAFTGQTPVLSPN